MITKIIHGLLAAVVLFIGSNALLAQTDTVSFNSELTNFLKDWPAEKVYVHTDRDIYTVNDTVWFKIYLTGAYGNIPQMGFRNTYIELTNEQDECLVRNLILCINGFGDGDFMLPNYELKQGKYKLRAYTNYQRNFGSDFYFEKNLYVKELLPSQADYLEHQDQLNQKAPRNDSIDFQLMPEGGCLTYNVMNVLAFKAIGTDGLSVNVSGLLKDETGEVVDTFKTVHAGMGKLAFVPRRSKSYTMTLNEYPDMIIHVPASTDKINMRVSDLGEVINVKIVDVATIGSAKNLCLVVSSEGVNSFIVPFQMDMRYRLLNLKKEWFNNGVSRLVLVDGEMNPIAERLVFVKKSSNTLVDISPDKKHYTTRDKVQLDLQVGVHSVSNLSVSVVNANQVLPLEDYPENILSYLLLGSELKGNIENPSFYFKDDSVSTKEKLDLLLLTQGWSAYVWEKFDYALPDTVSRKEMGLSLTGTIKKILWNKAVGDGSVCVFLQNKDGFSYISQTKTELDGKFCFPSLFFPDTTSMFLQARNKNERSNTDVKEVSTFPARPMDIPSFTDFSLPNEKMQEGFNRLSYISFVEDKAYNPEKYEHMLGEIEVVKSKSDHLEKDDGHSRMYGIADNVLVVEDKDRSYSNIWDYIAGRVAGVVISGNSVSIRGAVSFNENGAQPLFLLDGIAVDKSMLDGLTMGEVDKVEVLKSPVNLAVFGMRGGNGAIAVYTRRGDSGAYYVQDVNGTFRDKLRGYTLSRKFYSPNYQVSSIAKKDHRATIFWNPQVTTDSLGIAQVSFFTSDDLSSLQIRVEGVSLDGTPVVGCGNVMVSDEAL